MKITLLTCTGDRPLCFSLLERWLSQQTVKYTQWLVVDDGKIETKPRIKCDYIRRTPLPIDPQFTLSLNIQTALPFIDGDIILFCEDDEYYAPKYVEVMSNYLRDFQVVGICHSKYYHLPSFRYYVHLNNDHASLAQTGIQKSFLDELNPLLDGDSFVDIRIWERAIGGKLRWNTAPFIPSGMPFNNNKGFLFQDNVQPLYVGMKGMPGRGGIGSGHKGIGSLDADQRILKMWMPQDYVYYLQVAKANKLKNFRKLVPGTQLVFPPLSDE